MNSWFKFSRAIPRQPFFRFHPASDFPRSRKHPPPERLTLLAGGERWLVMVALFWVFWAFPGLAWSNYLQLDMVLDAKSKFSDGCSSVHDLAGLALSKNVDGLVVADHHRVSLEYGWPPFHRIFKKKFENGSVLKYGAVAYLAEIRQMDQDFEKLLVIPAVESTPFYYWKGRRSEKNLEAHHWDKHLLILGLSSPSEYEQIPSLNSNLSTRYMHRFLWPFLLFVFLTAAGLTGFFRKKWPRLSLALTGLALLSAINFHPFRSSPYDPYKGDPGMGPYQEVIDYATGKGALVFWNHLESGTANRVRTLGEMTVRTAPHPEDLLRTQNYTGFPVVDDAPVPAAAPGKEWDLLLREYLQGKRAHPVWGFGANDFHCEDLDGHRMGGVRTVVLVRKKEAEAVMDALKKGRMYAVRQPQGPSRLSLDKFVVVDETRGWKAVMGETLRAAGPPAVEFVLGNTQSGGDSAARLTLIRNGAVVKQETVSLPYRGNWRDVDVEVNPLRPVYYRLAVETERGGRLVSNPVFVRFDPGGQKVARLDRKAAGLDKEAAIPRRKPQVQEPSVANIPSGAQAPLSPETPTPPTAPQGDQVPHSMKAGTPPRSDPSAVPAPKSPASPGITPPAGPKTSSPSSLITRTRIVLSRIEGLSMKKGPGAAFPEVVSLKKGDSMEWVRRSTVVLNGKPWVVVRKDGRQGYVWEGFIEYP